MTEAGGTNPMASEVVRRARDTLAFLRMAAIELRRVAEREPHLAAELEHLVHQLNAEAEDWLAVLPNNPP